MQLPFFKNKPHLQTKETLASRSYLFAVEIGPEIVKTAIWSVVNDKPQVLAVGQMCKWDDSSENSLIESVDQSLSQCINLFDPTGKAKIDQVILGLPPTWVVQDKINPDKLQLLKALSSKLELKPVGFVVTPEAVVKFLAHTENVPSTAIFLGFWPNILEVTLVRMGRIEGVHHVKRSDSVAEDVAEGISRFPNVDILPSRMMLYDSGLDLEDIKQTLLAFPWQAPQKKLPFLHFPKIEILSSDFTVRAIATAGGSEVAQALGLITEVETAPKDLGFSPNLEMPQAETEVELEVETPLPVVAETFKPIKNKIKLPKIKLPKLPILILPVVLVLVGLFAAYWYLPKATVTLFVTPRLIDTGFSFVADTSAKTADFEKSIVPGSFSEVSLNDSKTSPTTGSKLVGDKATGSVTVENGLDVAKTFAAGTVITSPSGFKFVLDESVTVASASGSIGNLILGKANVKVTAANIGTDSNLSAGTVFRVGAFAVTQIDARNDIALSGGTSRQVKAVSKDDVAKLKSDLTQSLKDKARDQLVQQISAEQTIIPESITIQTVSEDLNHKEDEAADEVTLKVTVKAKGIVVSKSDIQNMIDAKIKPLIPQGFTAPTESSQSFIVKKSDSNTMSFDTKVTAKILPGYDLPDVAKNIVGKSPSQAKLYLEKLDGVSQIDILVNPNIPVFPASLPHIIKNITLSVRPAN
ncbi:MAG: hypothetical protein UU93_C0009G0020 [Candidatus Amesbacteria bacterium GW2011_GWA2_42_12]|uniref:Baseplate protein J-like domain-containing protein n=1 Tax=Candidatus Amesbacteria bacterium GW2011_GWA2_42_12 TaxID=1618356 RepID=A0A0G0Y651_9BACT|nr:MAG: hypothetical protein UU93_C0009G0020 [Candidatus Amesbacteria bacterium GW2011_GWA2_42_12]